jgi:hypothetical protein
VRYGTVIVLAVGALALAGAGCGGDDGDAAAPAETTVEESTEPTEEPAEETTETLGDIDLGDLSGECAELAAIGAKLAQAVGTQGGDVGASADYFAELADAAPDEIKDDLEVFAEEFATYAEAIAGIDLSGGTTPSAEDIAKLQEASAAFDDPRLEEASANIEAWAQENCTTG